MKLIFEKGTPGRHCHLLPDCDVPVHQIGVGRKEKLNLPELSENDISRHYTGLAGRRWRALRASIRCSRNIRSGAPSGYSIWRSSICAR